MLRWFAPAPARPRLTDAGEVDRRFRRLRASILTTLVASYGIAYTGRLGLGVVKKPLIDGGVYDSVELGWIGAGFFWGYAVGKLINGFIADRVNPRVFWATGLAVSGVVNLAMGSNSLVAAAVALWLVNGWFQGFGAPTCVVSMTQWFTSHERGSAYGIWSSAHAIGEGLTFIGTGTLVAATMWRAAFWGPGALLIVTAITTAFVLRDRPESVGLPPVAEWKADGSTVPPAATRGLALLRSQLSLLARPAIWVIGLSSLTMYVTRYAINSWGVLYLEETHGFSAPTATTLIGLNAIAGIGGCIAYGVISDRLFASRRPPVTLLFGLLEIAGLCLLLFAPHGNHIAVGAGCLLYGFTLSGILAVLGGLFAVDIAPRNTTGAAMGVIGVFSYVGAGLQDMISGVLIDRGTTVVDGVRHYDFGPATTLWIGASVASMLLAASLWRVRSSD